MLRIQKEQNKCILYFDDHKKVFQNIAVDAAKNASVKKTNELTAYRVHPCWTPTCGGRSKIWHRPIPQLLSMASSTMKLNQLQPATCLHAMVHWPRLTAVCDSTGWLIPHWTTPFPGHRTLANNELETSGSTMKYTSTDKVNVAFIVDGGESVNTTPTK